ncbi:hypothetical protein MKD33_12325, partial [Chromobacterium piscinae]
LIGNLDKVAAETVP